MQYSYNTKKPVKSTKSTVIVVNSDKPMASFEMSTWVIHHGKKIFFGVSTLAAALAVAVVTLGAKQISTTSENIALNKQVEDLKNYNSAEAAAKISELKKSETTVNALQNYLHERGINPDGTTPNTNDAVSDDNTPAVGGVYRPISAELPYGNRFNQNTQKVLDAIKNVPIGVPYHGTITSEFGNRSNPFGGRSGENHSGMDFRGPIGDAILATADGVVVQAGRAGGYGNAVKISHGYQLETLYGHMSEVDVTVGQKVKAGETIGKLGNTGRSTGPHLHYEVRRDGTPIDPAGFLNLQEM